MDVAERAREHVLAAHGDLVETVLTGARDAAADLDQPADRRVVTTRMELALRKAGAVSELADVIRSTAEELGVNLPAEPVPAPPYVVLTARGPMLRFSVEAGRLVILLRCFERAADGYVRADAGPESAVEVVFHESA